MTKVMGWTVDSGLVPVPKCVVVCAPHTSNWDFVVSYLYYRSCGGRAHFMMKKELFIPPLSWIVRALGAFPIDRKHPTEMVKNCITALETKEHFHIAMSPEGTRKAVKNWKTGYHLIAKSAGVPVWMAYCDWGTKHIGLLGEFKLTDNAREDTKRLQETYGAQGYVARHPENFVTK